MIQLGVQSESLAADRVVARLHPRLNELFDLHCPHAYCPAIDTFELVLRVGSRQKEFGAEGLQRRRFMRKRRYISIDLVVNEDTVLGRSEAANGDHLLDLIRQALEQCVEKLKAERCPVDEERLFADYAKVEADFHEGRRRVTAKPPL
jgi:hypothetical protein